MQFVIKTMQSDSYIRNPSAYQIHVCRLMQTGNGGITIVPRNECHQLRKMNHQLWKCFILLQYPLWFSKTNSTNTYFGYKLWICLLKYQYWNTILLLQIVQKIIIKISYQQHCNEDY